MQIVQSGRFVSELNQISDFIAQDSVDRAIKFQNELFKHLQIISKQPYSYRKSQNFDDERVRDFIFKKYVVPYFVGENEILLLGIYKKNLWKINNFSS